MNYLYFAEDDVQTGGASNPEALLIPADHYLGSNPVSTTTADFFFKSVDGVQNAREIIRLTYFTTANGGGYKKVNDAMCAAANASPHSSGFVVIADMEVTAGASGKTSVVNKLFNGMGITVCAIA